MLQTHVKNDIYNKYCLIHNNSLTHKLSSNVSRAFPSENHILHAFVRLVSMYRRIIKLSHMVTTAQLRDVVQSFPQQIVFVSAPMMLCIQEEIMRFDRKQK